MSYKKLKNKRRRVFFLFKQLQSKQLLLAMQFNVHWMTSIICINIDRGGKCEKMVYLGGGDQIGSQSWSDPRNILISLFPDGLQSRDRQCFFAVLAAVWQLADRADGLPGTEKRVSIRIYSQGMWHSITSKLILKNKSLVSDWSFFRDHL